MTEENLSLKQVIIKRKPEDNTFTEHSNILNKINKSDLLFYMYPVQN